MKFDTQTLVKLAHGLDLAAEEAKAKAKIHEAHKETDLEAQQLRRFTRNLDYAATVRSAVQYIEQLEGKKEAKTFTKPTRDQVAEYAAELKWPAVDANKWYDHFESNGWKVGGKTPMKDWRAAVRNGHRNWLAANPGAIQRTAVAQKTIDPEGWADWLKKKGEKFTPYAFAQDFLKKDFRKEMFG